MPFRFCVMLAAAAALGACATTGAPLGDEPVDRRYQVTGGAFGSDSVIYVAARAFESDGKLALCGVYSPRFAYRRGPALEQKALAGSALVIDGEEVIAGLRGFTNVGLRDETEGAPAGCVRTAVDWRPAFADAPIRYDYVGRHIVLRD